MREGISVRSKEICWGCGRVCIIKELACSMSVSWQHSRNGKWLSVTSRHTGPMKNNEERSHVTNRRNKQPQAVGDYDGGHLSCKLCGQVTPIQKIDYGEDYQPG